MATLAEKQAELVKAKDALNAARLAASYGQGDRSLQRAPFADLELHVARVAREVRQLELEAAGGTNTGVVTPQWT